MCDFCKLFSLGDPDVMPHYMAFHQVRQNQSSEKDIQYILKIRTCDPSVYTMEHPDLNVSNFMEKSIGLHRV